MTTLLGLSRSEIQFKTPSLTALSEGFFRLYQKMKKAIWFHSLWIRKPDCMRLRIQNNAESRRFEFENTVNKYEPKVPSTVC